MDVYITWTGNTNRFTDNRYSIFVALKSAGKRQAISDKVTDHFKRKRCACVWAFVSSPLASRLEAIGLKEQYRFMDQLLSCNLMPNTMLFQ